MLSSVTLMWRQYKRDRLELKFPVPECAGLVIKVTSFLVPGEWMWIDNSVVDYTNWKTGMPKSETCVDINSDSGQWNTNSCSRYRSYICKTAKGKFNQLLSSFKLTHQSLTLSMYSLFSSYYTYRKATVCWWVILSKIYVEYDVSKSSYVTINTPLCFASSAHVVKEASHSSAGITVAIVLVVIAIVGFGAFLLFRKRIPTPVLGESTFDNKLYFTNPMRAQVDTKGLVANIEQNEQA